jgi:hypothetical protein
LRLFGLNKMSAYEIEQALFAEEMAEDDFLHNPSAAKKRAYDQKRAIVERLLTREQLFRAGGGRPAGASVTAWLPARDAEDGVAVEAGACLSEGRAVRKGEESIEEASAHNCGAAPAPHEVVGAVVERFRGQGASREGALQEGGHPGVDGYG